MSICINSLKRNLSRGLSKMSFRAVAVTFFIPSAYGNTELYFAPELLSSDPQMVADLSRFEKTGVQLPGTYQVEVFVNDIFITTREFHFMDATVDEKNADDVTMLSSYTRDNTGLMACITRNDLENFNVNTGLYLPLDEKNDTTCISPGRYIPEAYTKFDFERMRLDISIPQVAMRRIARGFISPERWDNGINSFLLNYSFSGNVTKGDYENSSHFLNLNSGINIGAWRLRDYRTWNEYTSPKNSYSRWQHMRTYAERPIAFLHSGVKIGDISTRGVFFDSLAYRGLQLATDDSMFPDSQRGYAPIVRGTANSNAKVSIRQNGYTIYQTYVQPGAFEIEDLYPLGASGDLEVIITEADGTVRVSKIPFSSVSTLLREGRIDYDLTFGRYRGTGGRYEEPDFAQGTLVWGLPANITVYSGLQYSKKYFASMFGAGMNMGTFGAFSADATHADSVLADNSHHRGYSLRMVYTHTLNSLGTTVQLSGYRYSSQGFYTLSETALKGVEGWLHEENEPDIDGSLAQRRNGYYNLYNTRRSKLQASVSQRIGNKGSLYLTGVRQTYHNNDQPSDSLQVGFNSAIGSVNYNLSYSYSRIYGSPVADETFFLSLSMPLDAFMSGSKKRSTTYATYNGSRDSRGAFAHQIGLSGTALDNNNLSWNASQVHAPSEGNGGNLGLNYRGTYGSVQTGYSYSNSYRQMSYGFSGGALLHAEGLTVGQSLGETNVLVAAPGLKGVALENENGVRTDWRGFAIKPYASMYRENRVALDTSSLDDRTDLDDAVSHVVPTRGAVVKASFKGYTGRRVLMKILHDGKPLPFGTTIITGERSGIVGDEGQVYLSGLPSSGTLTADWGSGRKCAVYYTLPEESENQPIVRINTTCK